MSGAACGPASASATCACSEGAATSARASLPTRTAISASSAARRAATASTPMTRAAGCSVAAARVRLKRPLLVGAAALAVTLGACGNEDSGDNREPSARAQLSVFEDHDALVREGVDKRKQTLDELRKLGVDTLRVGIKWNEVAPRERAYTGFANYDDLLQRAQA